MNPLVIKSATKIITNKYVLTTIIVLVAYLFLKGRIRKVIRKFREKSFDKNEAKDVNQIAQQYRAASNPSGISWMIDLDGTNEQAIDRLGYQTKGSFESITDAYKLKFSESLTDRMRKELDADRFQNWRNIVD